MPAAPLEIDALSAGYGPTQILSGVTFSVAAGERLAILGRNGMGKTTLLASLMGLSTCHGGRILLGGDELSHVATSRRARLGLGYVPQSRDIFRSLSVEENLSSGLKGRARTALDEAYVLFPRLAERRRNYGWQLSGGEQQMLAMARTLLGEPSVLLLDEPLEGLAPVICDQLMATITELGASGKVTVLLVEQQIDRALDFADRVMVLERGQIAWHGEASALAAEPERIERLLGVGIH